MATRNMEWMSNGYCTGKSPLGNEGTTLTDWMNAICYNSTGEYARHIGQSVQTDWMTCSDD